MNKTDSAKYMEEFTSRTRMLVGDEGLYKLAFARVAVFGAGGVGSAVIGGLARAGVGTIIIMDGDKVTASNMNRQILYSMEDVGRYKAEAAVDHIQAVNPWCRVINMNTFFRPGDEFPFDSSVYVVDAVDDVKAKVYIAKCCKEKGCREIAAMGAGNKLDPTKFRVADIYETRICPLAKVMRKEYKEAGIESLKVVYSTEEPQQMAPGQKAVGSISFIPPVMGYVIASEVVKDILAADLPQED
ncbi:MAG: ThiF family adenylyltransferase [Clostridia bacterium]|nr:ThiF family adenylyltransferase [Clostridia bacterium]